MGYDSWQSLTRCGYSARKYGCSAKYHGKRTSSYGEFLARLPPLPEASASWGFYEFNRRAGDFALGMALCVIDLQDDRITAARIGIGGIEDHPRRLPEAEAALIGRAFDAAAMAAAAEAAMRAVDPMEDATTSAEYRRDLTGTVITRALEAARLRTLALADPA